MEIKRDYSIRDKHTLRLGVTARWYAEPSSVTDVKLLLSDPIFHRERKLIIGGGSNLLFLSDFNGLIIKPIMDMIEICGDDERSVYLKVGAGVEWDYLVSYAVDRGWGGLENLSYIPGNVGAAPVQNIGAYGSEAKDSIHEVEYLDLESGSLSFIRGEDCKFGYRDSLFKRELKERVVIVSVTFKLSKYPIFNTDYYDLEQRLASCDNVDLQKIRDIVISIRREKLPDPSEIGNVGSFFKNPIISLEEASELKREYPDMKIYPVDDSSCKIPAGWLIEQCGFKGVTQGNVGVHNKQALVLLAYDGATGQELYDFAMCIRDSVKSRFKVSIEPEVNLIFS